MTPSRREILDGQKAYQRIRICQRTPLVGQALLFLMLLFAVVKALLSQHLLLQIISIVLTIFYLVEIILQRNRSRRDRDLLRKLKLKYGLEIYPEISKEPTSLYYYLFQKRYPPDNKGKAVELP